MKCERKSAGKVFLLLKGGNTPLLPASEREQTENLVPDDIIKSCELTNLKLFWLLLHEMIKFSYYVSDFWLDFVVVGDVTYSQMQQISTP